MPVILRKQNPKRTGTSKEAKPYYEFIGECYLHTMMGGRAIDIQEEEQNRDKESMPTMEFELR